MVLTGQAVVRLGGAKVDVDGVSKSIASYSTWLAQESAENWPNLTLFVASIDISDIRLNGWRVFTCRK
jgi:hypothetical protein